MRYLPISIDSRGKKVLIIGGGRSAYIKTKNFLQAEFFIELISDKFIDEFIELEKNNKERIKLIKKNLSYDFDDLTCDYLVLATNDLLLNEKLSKVAKIKKIPILDTSDSSKSDFFLNKIVERKPISLSISTDGKAPSIGEGLAINLEEFLKKFDFEKINLLIELRKILKRKKCKNIRETMKKAEKLDKNELESYIEGLYEDKNWK